MKSRYATAAAEDMNVHHTTVSSMARYFDGKVGAVAYLLFILIYAPCVAAIGAIFRETSMKWTLLSVSYLTLLAWVVSTVFYQLGTFSRHPAGSVAWLTICAATLVGIYTFLRINEKRMGVASSA